MGIGWSFPGNGFGLMTGINEAGIETFKGAPYRSLAREICQNSLDARVGDKQPVLVEFKKIEVETNKIDKFSELQEVLYCCRKFWKENHDIKATRFYDKAVQISERKTIPILRISDFNTTGLLGAADSESIETMDIGSPWIKLVKGVGLSGKESGSGGSYGIGKSAAYACSDLRTVYYSTIDIKGEQATQGVAKLSAFITGRGENKEYTSGNGFFGETYRNQPIYIWQSLDPEFKRTESGTDVCILGFSEREGWEQEIISSILEDFLMAVYEGKLEVRVGEENITQNTLGEMIEKYQPTAPNAYNYYLALTSENAQCQTLELNHMGQIELHLIFQSGMHRRVLMCRSNGIRVFDQKNISATIQFAGICKLKGDELNEFFRGMENPQHNAWEPERHSSNPTLAKKVKQDLTRLIKNTVLEYGKKTTADEMDAEGVGEYLPDVTESLSGDEQKKETLIGKMKSVQVSEKEQEKDAAAGFEYSISGENTEQLRSLGSEDDEKMGGTGSKDDSDENPNQTEEGTGFGSEDGEGSGTNGEGSNRYFAGGNLGDKNTHRKFTMKTMAVRLFLVDKKTQCYQLTFTPRQNAEKGYLQLKILGEQSSVDVNILEAINMKNGKKLDCKENKIRIKKITKNVKQTIRFTIDYSESASMEVALYGYKG